MEHTARASLYNNGMAYGTGLTFIWCVLSNPPPFHPNGGGTCLVEPECHGMLEAVKSGSTTGGNSYNIIYGDGNVHAVALHFRITGPVACTAKRYNHNLKIFPRRCESGRVEYSFRSKIGIVDDS